MSMNEFNWKIGDHVECIAVSGKRINGRVIRVLENTIIVSNGIDTEVIRKKYDRKMSV
ncbi:MAG: hypothetical protein H9W82_15875 [Lactobacillus sp.]|nr:hypothetical protein [Lactobacillus sp.]